MKTQLIGNGKPAPEKQEFDLSTRDEIEVESIDSLTNFLAKLPPGAERMVLNWCERVEHPAGGRNVLKLSIGRVPIYCPSDECQREQIFQSPVGVDASLGFVVENRFLILWCNNCGRYTKTFAIRIGKREEGGPATFRKIGEYPPFGAPTPTRLISIFGGDKELFEKGKRAESQNMGIAAYAYYRRVVENRKGEIIQRFIAVAEKMGASTDLIAQLKEAKEERQFTNAVEKIRAGIPEVLKIEGYNPLTLLHDALSDGLHALSDEECLALAQNIRTILAAMVERINYALSEDRALKDAVTALAQRKSQTKK